MAEGNGGLTIRRPQLGLRDRLRRAVGAKVVDGFFGGAARSFGALPLSNPSLHGVRVERDVSYGPAGRDHLLDLYRPARAGRAPLPVVFYIHGGGFRILSKDSHWLFGLAYARRGFLVVNANYRLAPRHRFPAAVEDVFLAWQWLLASAERLGADLSKVVVAGESAGANLAAVLALAASYRRDEPFARRVFDAGVAPRAVVAACGLFDVSNVERFAHLGPLHRDRLEEVTDAYLDGVRLDDARTLELADPLTVFERGDRPHRPLPPFFLPCGTWDALLDDTRRLHSALRALGVRSREEEYARGPHAFHAFVFTPAARRCWRDTFGFLEAEGLCAPGAPVTAR